ncbi:hypothetical protein QTP88_012384 [Uroleucon formosanum]
MPHAPVIDHAMHIQCTCYISRFGFYNVPYIAFLNIHQYELKKIIHPSIHYCTLICIIFIMFVKNVCIFPLSITKCQKYAIGSSGAYF